MYIKRIKLELGGNMERRKRTKRSKVSKLLELPEEVVSNIPKITIVGFEEVLVENYKAILEYEDFYIKINTHIGAININGFNLKLKEMTGDDIMVLGRIDSMDFETITDET